MKNSIGFIGLGMMGFPMAGHLLAAGHALTVLDASPERQGKFLAEHPGATGAAGLADFAAMDMVITMLPDSGIVESVVLDQPSRPGLISLLRRGATLIDMSSSEPMRSRALAKTLADAGIGFLDAPVSGGMKRAVSATLAIMAGGSAQAFAACKPVLEAMGKTITHVGDAGAGHAVKALNNYVSAAGLTAAAEALLAGQRFGLDPAVMTDVINSSTGKNNTTEHKVKQYMLNGAFNSAFSLQLMAKDLGIAMALGKSVGQKMELGDGVLDLWNQAAKALGKTADHTEMYRYLQSRN